MTNFRPPPPAGADRVPPAACGREAPADSPRNSLLPIAHAIGAEIRLETTRLAVVQGRAAIVRILRRAAGDLASSLLADDQVRRAGYLAAADDLTWGRPPLDEWLQEMEAPVAAERARVRARIPPPTGATLAAARRAAGEIRSRRLDGTCDALDAARALPMRLREASVRQLAASDDPRLNLLPVQRSVMLASAELLREEADYLAAPLSFKTLGSMGASWWRSVRHGILPDRQGW